MEYSPKLILFFTIFGFYFQYSIAQSLTTKCPSNAWTKYLERCYLFVNYNHSFSKALNYCQKYGAHLAEPAGYTVNSFVAGLIDDPDVTHYRIGYNRQPNPDASPTVGYWSDGRQTTLDVGLWARREPDIAAGHCANVMLPSNEWYMGSCDTVMPFVCEIDPCPSGPTDTFMCNGRCIGMSLVCDGRDDCGDNMDEINCANQNTFMYQQDSGTIQPQLTNGRYRPNEDIIWTIVASVGSRITYKFEDLSTEEDADFVYIYDGGPTIATSNLVHRFSGSSSANSTTSYNFLIVRFVSDAQEQKTGFRLTWSTEHECVFRVLLGYTYANTEIATTPLKLGTRLDTNKCRTECGTGCFGFSYNQQEHTCYFISHLPVLEQNADFDLHTKTCPDFASVKASIPLFNGNLVATASMGQLATPLYPTPYVGNMELEYVITTPANNLITLEVVTVELCCGDYVEIYDKSHDLLTTLTSESTPHYILSTGNTVYIRMILEKHGQCSGVLFQYKQGCDLTYTGSGMLTSPGYGTTKSYPGLTMCTWRIDAPSEDRSITLLFDDFDLAAGDTLSLEAADGTLQTSTGSSLLQQPVTMESYVTLTFLTSSMVSGRGFSVSFSPGCPSLGSTSYLLSSSSFNYGDSLTVSCADGYFFTGEYSGQSSVQLTCLLGGTWNVQELPVCAQGFCGLAEGIDNGYLVTSEGVQGGDMAEYTCDEGFTLEGSDQVSCLANNLWQARPSCSSPLCSVMSTLAPTTSSDILLGDGTSHGSVARLGCADHSEIIGAETVQCDQGRWDFQDSIEPACRYKLCETPVIPNGFLSPQGPYNQDQFMTLTCQEGYDLVGPATFQCRPGVEQPSCVKKTCSIELLDASLTLTPDLDVYNYDDKVDVSCPSGFELDVATTTSLTLTCLATGIWDRTPICRRIKCGEPYAVGGSAYTYIGTRCTDYGCSFEFTCRARYELYGASSQGDHIVTCGMAYDGLWDFGDLRCIGGQCPDPGYPPSGFLVGDSFQEGSTVTFECFRSGYAPVNLDGSLNTGITCVYNMVRNMMEWQGQLPTCKDIEKPEIRNCPGPDEVVVVETLGVLDIPEPYPSDNNAVKTYSVQPINSDINKPIPAGTIIFYTVTDYADNTITCELLIQIQRSIECLNSESTLLEVGEFSSTTSVGGAHLIRIIGFQLIVTPLAPVVTIPAERAALSMVQEVEVTAYDGEQEVDRCTLQFRVKPIDCATWVLNMPNTVTTCVASQNTCDLQCDAGFYFMDDPNNPTVQMTCVNNVWNRTPPICASSTENYIRYSATYTYKYTINDGIPGGVTVCNEVYQPQVEANLRTFATDMEAICNQGNTANPVNVTLDSVVLTHLESTLPHRLSVRFSYHITVLNEDAENTQTLKEQCADTVQSVLNLRVDISAIQSVSGDPGQSCGQGSYDTASGTGSFHHACLGHRKYFFANQLCLECPLGHYYDSSADDCLECPDGTYGATSSDGNHCVKCSNGAYPGITGLTNADGCFKKAICGPGYFSFTGLSPCTVCPKNFYNPDPASRTCKECDSGDITTSSGEISSGACLNLNETIEMGVVSPCSSDPCSGNGECTIINHDYFCTCDAGYTGQQCDVAITACSSNPCENNQGCRPISEDPGFVCGCNENPDPASELTGTYCEIDRFGCQSDLCSNNGTCHNQRGAYSCKCPTHGGYTNHGNCDIEIDQCVENPCEHGTCVTHGSYYRSCICNPGYTGLACETNIDDCASNPCQNGATCSDGLDFFTCTCLETYHGNLCQFRTSCDQQCTSTVTRNCHSCNDLGTSQCRNEGNSYTCDCLPGYTGTNCEVEISPCNSYPCQHGGTCLAQTGGFNCNCLAPWRGDHCQEQQNNCPDGSECFNGGTCYSTPSGYRCDCPYNFIGPDCTVPYDLCSRANPCVGPGSTCSVSDNGQVQCSCSPGYSGTYCQIMLPSCTSTTCAHGSTCSDDGGVVTCSCAPGYSGSTCELNIDECQSDSCSVNQECVDGINSYTCVCAPGKLGESCNKDVSLNFDYIIKPQTICRIKASQAMFGDGVTDVTSFSVAFWVRYSHAATGTGALMSVYGSNSGDTMEIPESPDFELLFGSEGAYVNMKGTASGRRKRQSNEFLSFGASVDDGYWHHVAAVWINSTREINLYLDGFFKDQKFLAPPSIGTRMFLVFGAFNTILGTTDPANSFEGRISQLHVQNIGLDDTGIAALKNNFNVNPVYGANEFLYQERTLMLQYPINYNSELTQGICLTTDLSCRPLNNGVSVPLVSSCPEDPLALTPRGGSPNWVAPTFDVTPVSAPVSNMISGGTALDWGVHGISYAVFDNALSAAVCSFRLFNYKELSCNIASGSNTPFYESVAGGRRYNPTCQAGQYIAGEVPTYQLCNKYSMWNGDIKYDYTYVYPVCSGTSIRKLQTTMTLEVQIANSDCQTALTQYRLTIQAAMTTLNIDLDGKLCPNTCVQIFNDNAISCDGADKIKIQLDLGLLESEMTLQGSIVSIEEVLKIAVGDRQVFHYDSNGIQASPVITALAVTSFPACENGFEVSGDICVECGAGTQYNTVCERCSVGTYRQATPAATSCLSCHESLTTVGEGSTSQSFCIAKCQPGRYYDQVLNACELCAVGFYQDTIGAFTCKPCGIGLSTASRGANSVDACQNPTSFTTTTEESNIPGPGAAAATEDDGSNAGIIAAAILGSLVVLLIIILIICFCCCRDIIPCCRRQKQTVAPTAKEGYYADKYGAHNMQFVSYNLRDVREKKGRPLDRMPIVEPPLSDETGSVKTDISVHVPVFKEKLDGRVKKKPLYMSNGGQALNSSRGRSHYSSAEPTPRTYEVPRSYDLPPLTSSPRDAHYDEVQEDSPRRHRTKKKRRRRRKDRSGERSHRSADRSPYHGDRDERSQRSRSVGQGRVSYDPDYDEIPSSIPKALAPMPHRLKSLPPSDVHLRPLSPLSRPRAPVKPNEYQDFLEVSNRKSSQKLQYPSRSYDDDEPEMDGSYMRRIEVESDEDLR